MEYKISKILENIKQIPLKEFLDLTPTWEEMAPLYGIDLKKNRKD